MAVCPVQWFRLREAPVATLLTIAVLAAALTGSTVDVHGLRPDAPQPAAQTKPRAVIKAWKKRTRDCLVTLADGTQARPMIFVAAEGGGIRAAYWTAAVLEALHEDTGCGTDAVVVASGVSGGSVGLAVSRVAGVAGASDVVWRLGDADALAQASLGLLVRDPLHVLTGVPALVDGVWLDRAGLMETAWAGVENRLDHDFYAPAAEEGLAAPLVLNAADATSGCRLLATHLELDVDGGTPAACTEAGAPLAYSRNLRDYVTRTNETKEQDHCLDGLRTSTAAMASARFPYVTPSGVVGPCQGTPRAQIIDGGYAEGSGLGTLVDLAPSLLRKVKVGQTDPKVLPIVVFLDNGRGGDLLPIAPDTRSELMVPPLGKRAAPRTPRQPGCSARRRWPPPVPNERTR